MEKGGWKHRRNTEKEEREEGTNQREWKWGHQRDGESRRREAEGRSGSQVSLSARSAVTSSASGLPSGGPGGRASVAQEPLCRRPPRGAVPFPGLRLSGSPSLLPGQAGLGSGAAAPEVNERAIGVWREWTTQCDEEVGTEFASWILHQLEPLPPKPDVWPSRLYSEKPGVVPKMSQTRRKPCPTGLPKEA